jgi:hypothetical protein
MTWFESQLDLDQGSWSSSTRPGPPPIWRAATGARPKGERLRAVVPHGHWKTTTFVAGLCLEGLAALFVFDGKPVAAWRKRNGFSDRPDHAQIPGLRHSNALGAIVREADPPVVEEARERAQRTACGGSP